MFQNILSPPPPGSSSQLKYFVQIANPIVAQLITMPTNDEIVNVKIDSYFS